ncbi:MAG: hypothetical protein ACLKAN_13575 [Alkaliphilus sp.]
MGTWGVSSNELVEKLTDCLDKREGDFDKKTLRDALKFMEGYCPTSDSTTKEEKVWRNLFAKLGENNGK